MLTKAKIISSWMTISISIFSNLWMTVTRFSPAGPRSWCGTVPVPSVNVRWTRIATRGIRPRRTRSAWPAACSAINYSIRTGTPAIIGSSCSALRRYPMTSDGNGTLIGMYPIRTNWGLEIYVFSEHVVKNSDVWGISENAAMLLMLSSIKTDWITEQKKKISHVISY